MQTRVWRASAPKKKNKQSEAYKQQMINQLTAAGKCPKRPHELKMKDLERMLTQ